MYIGDVETYDVENPVLLALEDFIKNQFDDEYKFKDGKLYRIKSYDNGLKSKENDLITQPLQLFLTNKPAVEKGEQLIKVEYHGAGDHKCWYNPRTAQIEDATMHNFGLNNAGEVVTIGNHRYIKRMMKKLHTQ